MGLAGRTGASHDATCNMPTLIPWHLLTCSTFHSQAARVFTSRTSLWRLKFRTSQCRAPIISLGCSVVCWAQRLKRIEATAMATLTKKEPSTVLRQDSDLCTAQLCGISWTLDPFSNPASPRNCYWHVPDPDLDRRVPEALEAFEVRASLKPRDLLPFL